MKLLNRCLSLSILWLACLASEQALDAAPQRRTPASNSTDTARADSAGGLVSARVATADPELDGGLFLRARVEKRATWAPPLCPTDAISYSLTLLNLSDPGVPPQPASIVDQLPVGVTYIPASATAGATYDSDARQVVWNGELASGESVVVELEVMVDQGLANGTPLINHVASTLATLSPATEVDTPVDCAPLEIEVEKSVDAPSPLCPGSSLSYAVTLRNPNSRNHTLDAGIRDVVPDGTSFAQLIDGNATYDAATRTVTWSGPLGPGEEHTIHFAIEVDADSANGTNIDNLAQGTLSDPRVGDEVEGEDSEQSTVQCSDNEPCTIEVTGRSRVEGWRDDSGKRVDYPVPYSRIFFQLIADELIFGDLPRDLPLPPLSESSFPQLETTTTRTKEHDFDGEKFLHPEQARFSLKRTLTNEDLACPPRLNVIASLWDAADRFAVSSENVILQSGLSGLSQQRFMPLYLAQCVSLDPIDLGESGEGPCHPWQGGDRSYHIDLDFDWGKSPTVEESARVIGPREERTDPDGTYRASEEWWGPLPKDVLFLDGAWIYFHAYKAMEYFRSLEKGTGVSTDAVVLIAQTQHNDKVPGVLVNNESDAVDDSGPFTLCGKATVACTVVSQVEDGTLRFPRFGRFPGLDHRPMALESFPRKAKRRPFAVWHEMSHAYMAMLYGGHLPPDPAGAKSVNHGGYFTNPSTNDSMVEGFAHWGAMVIGQNYGDPKAQLLRIRRSPKDDAEEELPRGFEAYGARDDQVVLDIEVDQPVWGDFKLTEKDGVTTLHPLFPTAEEFAVAGVLWDLHDSGDEELEKQGVLSNVRATRDQYTLDVGKILHYFIDTKPSTLSALHDVVAFDFLNDRKRNVSDIFTAHAVFDDTKDRNFKQDIGEHTGGTGSSELPERSSRASEGPLPVRFLESHYYDRQGLELPPGDVEVLVRWRFASPHRAYDYDYFTRPSDDALGLLAPPELYMAQVSLRAFGPDGLASEPVLLDSRQVWDAIASDQALPAARFELEHAVCKPDETTLCLGDERFRVTVRWETEGGAVADGHAVPISEDVGYFWFFSSANVELLVKVLDGCAVNDRFWVFATGLTNVGVELAVEDTLSGETWQLDNPLGSPLETDLDTHAFASCSVF